MSFSPRLGGVLARNIQRVHTYHDRNMMSAGKAGTWFKRDASCDAVHQGKRAKMPAPSPAIAYTLAYTAGRGSTELDHVSLCVSKKKGLLGLESTSVSTYLYLLCRRKGYLLCVSVLGCVKGVWFGASLPLLLANWYRTYGVKKGWGSSVSLCPKLFPRSPTWAIPPSPATSRVPTCHPARSWLVYLRWQRVVRVP